MVELVILVPPVAADVVNQSEKVCPIRVGEADNAPIVPPTVLVCVWMAGFPPLAFQVIVTVAPGWLRHSNLPCDAAAGYSNGAGALGARVGCGVNPERAVACAVCGRDIGDSQPAGRAAGRRVPS